MTQAAPSTTPDKDVVKKAYVSDKLLTEQEMAANDALVEKELSKFLLHLYWKEPLFHRLLQAANMSFSRELVPTAGVAVKDGRIDFIINPDFMANLIRKNENHVIGLFQHEAYHLAYGHCLLKWKPHLVQNWATDLSINTNIPKKDLPDGGWIPGDRWSQPEEWDQMSQEDKDWFDYLNDLVESFPPRMDALYYYQELMKDPKIKEMIQKQQALSDLLMKVLSMDEHMDGEAISEGDLQVAQGLLAEAIAEAVAEAEKRGWGSVPSDTQAEIRALISKEVDWKSLLRQFVGRCRRSTPTTTYRRRSRKAPGVMPGRRRNRISRVAFFIDESGSMNDKALALLAGELNNLARVTDFDVYPFDTSINVGAMIKWKKGMTVTNFPRVKRGGTCFQCVVDFLNSKEMRGVYSGGLCLTDGGASKPGPSRLRLGYILTPGNELYFSEEAEPGTIVIKMTGENKE